MAKLVLSGAALKCSQGLAPSTLDVPPANLTFGEADGGALCGAGRQRQVPVYVGGGD